MLIRILQLPLALLGKLYFTDYIPKSFSIEPCSNTDIYTHRPLHILRHEIIQLYKHEHLFRFAAMMIFITFNNLSICYSIHNQHLTRQIPSHGRNVQFPGVKLQTQESQPLTKKNEILMKSEISVFRLR